MLVRDTKLYKKYFLINISIFKIFFQLTNIKSIIIRLFNYFYILQSENLEI